MDIKIDEKTILTFDKKSGELIKKPKKTMETVIDGRIYILIEKEELERIQANLYMAQSGERSTRQIYQEVRQQAIDLQMTIDSSNLQIVEELEKMVKEMDKNDGEYYSPDFISGVEYCISILNNRIQELNK
jgi:flagellar basal body rod protein FlgG